MDDAICVEKNTLDKWTKGVDVIQDCLDQIVKKEEEKKSKRNPIISVKKDEMDIFAQVKEEEEEEIMESNEGNNGMEIEEERNSPLYSSMLNDSTFRDSSVPETLSLTDHCVDVLKSYLNSGEIKALLQPQLQPQSQQPQPQQPQSQQPQSQQLEMELEGEEETSNSKENLNFCTHNKQDPICKFYL